MLHQPTTAAQLNGHAANRAFLQPSINAHGSALHVAHMDEDGRCLHLACYPHSSPDAIPASAIMRDAAELGSAGILLAHRHEEGPVSASARHWSKTRMLADAVELIEVTLVDHLVFHGDGCLSLRRAGAL